MAASSFYLISRRWCHGNIYRVGWWWLLIHTHTHTHTHVRAQYRQLDNTPLTHLLIPNLFQTQPLSINRSYRMLHLAADKSMERLANSPWIKEYGSPVFFFFFLIPFLLITCCPYLTFPFSNWLTLSFSFFLSTPVFWCEPLI